MNRALGYVWYWAMYPGIVLTDPAAPSGASDLALRPVSLASGGRSEAWLRDFLLAHPSVLPTAAIDPAYADPIPVCRELRTPAGPLDCLFATRFGGLVVVECKLWRNPQARREVVGQILDYAKETRRRGTTPTCSARSPSRGASGARTRSSASSRPATRRRTRRRSWTRSRATSLAGG